MQKRLYSTAFNKYHLSLGAGLTKVAGKVFRIGHLGDLNELQASAAINGAEMAMIDSGINYNQEVVYPLLLNIGERL